MKTNVLTRTLLFIPRKIFIAGKTQQEVLKIVAKLNSEGFLATIDVLGEHSKNEEEVGMALKEYERLVYAINIRKLKTTISIKLTHLGLELGFGYCLNTVRELADYARQNNVGIEFDAEEFKYRDETIEIFQSLSKPDDGNRICLQANIFKSSDDLETLHDQGRPARLVKGAYEEASDVAHWDRNIIRDNFISLINIAILKAVNDKSNGVSGPKHAIGTRDKKIIAWVKDLIEAYSLDKCRVEFQLLYGYLELGRSLLRDGYPIRIYLPYGDDEAALPYVLRRIKTPHSWGLFFDWLLGRLKTRT